MYYVFEPSKLGIAWHQQEEWKEYVAGKAFLPILCQTGGFLFLVISFIMAWTFDDLILGIEKWALVTLHMIEKMLP